MSFTYFCLLGKKRKNVVCWKMCLMKARIGFAVLVLSVQQAKLTRFHIISDGVGFIFPYSVLSLEKMKELTCSGLI